MLEGPSALSAATSPADDCRMSSNQNAPSALEHKDRLTSLDAEFLHLEDENTPMHIGGLCVLDGPAPTLAELRGAIASRLEHLPRYRQRVESVPLEMGRPVWVDHADFRIPEHVRQREVPTRDESSLDETVATLFETALDRSRPLWEVWLLDGLSGDRWAIVAKVHHCLADGVAGMQLLEALFDAEPDATVHRPAPWTPAEPPGSVRKVIDAWTGMGDDLTRWVGAIGKAVTHPVKVAGAARDQVAGLARLLPNLRPTPHSSIEGHVGKTRVWAHESVRLADIRPIRERFECTVNDVLVASVTAGYRELLLAHGDDVNNVVVRSLVPVSVRSGEIAGNQISVMVVDLPVHLDDPAERLCVVTELMSELKRSHEVEAAAALTHVADVLPPLAVGTLSRWATRLEHVVTQRSVTTVVTNVPGPQLPLFALGREMVEFVPYVGLSQGVRVTTAIASYNGAVALAVTADAASVPDAAIIVDSAAREVDTLRRIARRRRVV